MTNNISEEKKSWRYSSENDHPAIFLHDCCVEAITDISHDVVFAFNNEGFWISEQNRQNCVGKTCRTGISEIRFVGCDASSIEIRFCKHHYMFSRVVRKTVLDISFEELKHKLAAGEWRFEIINEYYGLGRAVLDGFVNCVKEKNNFRNWFECQVKLNFDKMIYSWDEIRADRYM